MAHRRARRIRCLARLTAVLAAAPLVTLPLVVSGVGGASASGPSVGVEHDRAEFVADNPIVVEETFDRFAQPRQYPADQKIVHLRGFKFRSIDLQPPSWLIDGTDRELSRTFAATAGPDATADVGFVFGKRQAVDAVGFSVRPFGVPNTFVIRVTEADGSISRIGPGELGETFFGLTSEIGIVRVVIAQRDDLAGGYTNYAIDDLARSRLHRR